MRIKFLQLNLTLLVVTFVFHSVLAQSNSPISFTKKEIAFLKWGDGRNEVKLNKTKHKLIDRSKGVTETKEFVSWTRDIKIDGNDNIYFRGGNDKIFIVSSDGSSIKTISAKKTGGLMDVDDDGDIFAPYHKIGEPEGFIRTKPDGTQEDFKHFSANYMENGIAYDINKNKAITIADKGDQPEKLPPRLFSRVGEVDYGINAGGELCTIYTKKINKHLKKINQKIDADKIHIKVEEKDGMPPRSQFLGIDDNGNSYFLCGYYGGRNSSVPWKETYVMVYSQTGQKLTEIPVDTDYFDKQLVWTEFKIDIHGMLFQMWTSEDGIHIFKWTKN